LIPEVVLIGGVTEQQPSSPSSAPRSLLFTSAGGFLLSALAAIAIFAASRLSIGTLSEIGSGLFPISLAIILLGLAAAIAIQDFRKIDSPLSGFNVRRIARPLVCILGAVVVFGLTIRTLGIAGAAPLALLIGGLASAETKWMELIPFVAGLTLFCTLLFRFALSLPIPLAPWLVGY
jgi:hypothetical protein